MSERTELALRGIIEAIEKIETYCHNIYNADEFFVNCVIFDACLMNFVIIGEMVSRVDEDFKKANTQIPWNTIKAFRNVVVHDYFGIDAEEVWQIVTTKLSVLKRDLQPLLDS